MEVGKDLRRKNTEDDTGNAETNGRCTQRAVKREASHDAAGKVSNKYIADTLWADVVS